MFSTPRLCRQIRFDFAAIDQDVLQDIARRVSAGHVEAAVLLCSKATIGLKKPFVPSQLLLQLSSSSRYCFVGKGNPG